MVLSCDNNDASYYAMLGFQDRGQFLIFVFFNIFKSSSIKSVRTLSQLEM